MARGSRLVTVQIQTAVSTHRVADDDITIQSGERGTTMTLVLLFHTLLSRSKVAFKDVTMSNERRPSLHPG